MQLNWVIGSNVLVRKEVLFPESELHRVSKQSLLPQCLMRVHPVHYSSNNILRSQHKVYRALWLIMYVRIR